MKLKTLLQILISRAKSILVQLIDPLVKKKNKSKTNNRLFLGSSASTTIGSSSRVLDVYYDPTWSPAFTFAEHDEPGESPELSGYLQWLEEDRYHNKAAAAVDEKENCGGEIDMLAEMFIASCHEKFKLEKEESYRRFQEMMARSVWVTDRSMMN